MQATPGRSALLLAYQSSHPGMTEMGENTVLPQSTTNDRVSNKIRYVHMNLFTKMRYKENTKEKSKEWYYHLELFWRSPAVVAAILFHSVCSYSVILGPTLVSSLPTDRLV